MQTSEQQKQTLNPKRTSKLQQTCASSGLVSRPESASHPFSLQHRRMPGNLSTKHTQLDYTTNPNDHYQLTNNSHLDISPQNPEYNSSPLSSYSPSTSPNNSNNNFASFHPTTMLSADESADFKPDLKYPTNKVEIFDIIINFIPNRI
jgi:hypothetical protein